MFGVLFIQSLDTRSRTSGPIFEQEDAETRFRNRNMRYRQNRDYSSRTMYNFDEWTRNHYGDELHARKQENMMRSYQRLTNRRNNESNDSWSNEFNNFLVCLFVGSIGIVYMFIIDKVYNNVPPERSKRFEEPFK